MDTAFRSLLDLNQAVETKFLSLVSEAAFRLSKMLLQREILNDLDDCRLAKGL